MSAVKAIKSMKETRNRSPTRSMSPPLVDKKDEVIAKKINKRYNTHKNEITTRSNSKKNNTPPPPQGNNNKNSPKENDKSNKSNKKPRRK
jgi:tRNA A22 N-methylase